MAKRLKTKIGDIFSVPISDTEKRYMQLIAFDLTQLNSDVVRIFQKKYPIDYIPNINDVIQDDIYTYVHCSADFGLKMNLWQIEGNSEKIGSTEKIIFRGTSDYGKKIGEEAIKLSSNWYIWRINDKNFTDVGKLKKDYQNSYIGLVINPVGIVEIAKGNKYPPNYPDFE